MATPTGPQPAKGRGSHIRPPSRFESFHRVDDYEHIADDLEWLGAQMMNPATQLIPDDSKSVVTQNDSPDLGFRYSVNPYRGCEHGCAYCYARPTHEFLGFNAGIDFETKVLYKPAAVEQFRRWLARPAWKPEPVCFSGVTDCYQPAERRLRLTRGCLQVALQAGQPVTIVTKNALILRDLDMLREMSERRIVHVAVSLTTLDEELARSMEPRTSTPWARLRAIVELSQAGVPTRAMIAPIIPGLNDSEIPRLLQAAAGAGAAGASYILLRLPLTVRPVFFEWLQRTRPASLKRIEGLIRSTRDGKLNDSRFGRRMRGAGTVAEQIKKTFRVFSRKYGLDAELPSLDTTNFRPPPEPSGQLRLF